MHRKYVGDASPFFSMSTLIPSLPFLLKGEGQDRRADVLGDFFVTHEWDSIFIGD